MNDKKSFVLYCDYETHISMLSDDDAGKLFKGIFAFLRTAEEPDLGGAPMMAFSFIRSQLQRDFEKWEEAKARRIEAGRKGGLASGQARKRTKQNEAMLQIVNDTSSTVKQNEANEAVTVNGTVTGNVTGNGTVNVNVKENKANAPSPARHKYGFYNNVLLSDEERIKLKAEYPDYERTLEELSAYIASTGKRYKSHYATIRNWRRKEQQKGGGFVGESAGLDGIKLNITTV